MLDPSIRYLNNYPHCRDTDSIMIAALHDTLEECERESLGDEVRERLRFMLYGSPEAYNYGKAKVEWVADHLTVLGPKCYYALNKDENDEETVACCKFKGCGAADDLTKETLEELGERNALLRERAPRIRRSAFGVRIKENAFANLITSSLYFRPTSRASRRCWPRSDRWS